MAEKDYIELGGDNFVIFPKEDELYPKTQMGVNFDLNIPNWTLYQNTQVIGNYQGSGWGVFLESGNKENFNVFVVDCGNNQLLKFNSDCGYQLQRSLPTTNIKAQTVDEFNNIYIYDVDSNTIFKYDANGLEIENIEFTYGGSINSIQAVGSVIHFMVEGVGVFNYQDYKNNPTGYTPIPTTHPSHNNFVILSNGDVRTFLANDCSRGFVDCDDNYYHIHGLNIYRNGDPYYYVGSGLNSFHLNQDGYFIIVYNNNRILKINTNGLKIYDKIFHNITPRVNSSSDGCASFSKNKINLSTTKVLTKDGYENFTWVMYEEGNYILILDEGGNMVNCFHLSKWLDTENYNLDISKTELCYTGAFTSSESLYSCVDQDENFLKLRIAIQSGCGDGINFIEMTHTVDGLAGSHTIQFTYDGDVISFIFDGVVVDERRISGSIYYSPFTIPIIIGAESGRFTAYKKEEGIDNTKYLEGVLSNLRIYDTHDIPRTTSSSNTTTDISISYPLNTPINYTEDIDCFFLLRPSGFKSSRMCLDVYTEEFDVDIEDFVPAEVVADEVKYKKIKRLKDLIGGVPNNTPTKRSIVSKPAPRYDVGYEGDWNMEFSINNTQQEGVCKIGIYKDPNILSSSRYLWVVDFDESVARPYNGNHSGISLSIKDGQENKFIIREVGDKIEWLFNGDVVRTTNVSDSFPYGFLVKKSESADITDIVYYGEGSVNLKEK